MLPLFDLLQSADRGRGMDLLARQFNLSRRQAELAVEALLPAFSEGLKRNAADPFGMDGLTRAMAGGGQARYFEDVAKTFSPAGTAQGKDLLDQIFGSPDLTRAIAEQAALATGIGQDILKQMMPALAAMLMGGLAKQAAAPDEGEPFAAMMRHWTEAARAMQPGVTGADSPFDNPFAKMFEAMNPGGAPKPQSRAAHADAPPDFYSAVSQMFETGRKGREDYEKAIASLFDQFTGARPAGSQ